MIKRILSFAAVTAIALSASAATYVEDAVTDFSKMTEYNLWKGGLPEGSSIELIDGILTIKNEKIQEHFYSVQYFIADNLPLETDKTYKVDVEIKGSSAGSANLALGNWDKSNGQKLEFSDSWGTTTLNLTNPASSGIHLIMQSGDYVGTIEIKKVTVSHELTNPDLLCLSITNASKKETGAQPWDQQLICDLDTKMEKGAKYNLSFEAMGDVEASIPLWLEEVDENGQVVTSPVLDDNGNPVKDENGKDKTSSHTQYNMPTLTVDTKWKQNDLTFEAQYDANRIYVCFGQYEGTDIKIDNIKLTKENSDVNLLKTSDFSDGKMPGWSKPNWHAFNMSVSEGPEHGTTGIGAIVAEDENAPVEFYNLQGVRVANPEGGIFIRRQGNSVTKVIVK